MASLRFGFTNLIETATLKNGTGGGAPALDEVSPNLTTNAQNRDRGMVWQAAASLNVDFALAAASACTLFGVLGHRGAPSSAVGVASIEVFTQTGVYTPGGAWTSRGTITLGSGVRDGGLIIASTTPASVRFAITATTAFTIGRLWAGATDYDLGVVSSPGYERRPVTPVLESRMGGGAPHLTQSGDEWWEYTLPYNDADSTLFAKLLAVGRRQSRTYLLIDRDDAFFEARTRSFSHSLMGDAPDIHNAPLSIETLG